MRIVLFSDIHGNVVALEAVLAEIRRQAAPDALFVAGDLVLLGPRPAEALALLRSLDGARFVKGNTDQYLIDGADDEQEVAFARRQLSEDDITFVRDLPFEQRLEVAPGHELFVRGDVGGFGVGSKFSWQAVGGYSFDYAVQNGVTYSGLIGYKALYADYAQGQGRKRYEFDMLQHGPVVGISLRW